MNIEISLGKNRSDTNWKPSFITWEEFTDLLQTVRRTGETMAEYDRMTRAEKSKCKDGKAFVGGLVTTGRRKKENVESRYLITLDADEADEDFLFNVDMALAGTAYAVYSTHGSRPQAPKYRVVVPGDEAMSPDEHAAVARKIADRIGMHYFDRTTFDVHRLMYFRSCSRDAEPVLIIEEGEPLNVRSVLGEYEDWRDPMQWPRHPGDDKHLETLTGKLGDPTDKPGVIGLFCELYSIEEGIETFLPDVYEQTTTADRWTFIAGTSVGGMRVYDDVWAYSEHQSDPANDGHCHNVFDLVRIHKFGELDVDVKDKTNRSKYPSFIAMEEFAAADSRVKKARLAQIREDFGGSTDDDASEEDDPDAWMDGLELSKKTGEALPTSSNIELVLQNGPFKKVLAYDAFGNTEVVRGVLPWRQRLRPSQPYEPWLGADDKRLQHYLAKTFGFKSAGPIQNAFTEVVHSNTFHPIKEYLEAPTWDGEPRADDLFITYLGAEDNHYTRQVTRKMLLAAVKRVYEPGAKFDAMLVLVGPQGAGKSTLLAKLGRKWFSDSLRTFDNKEAGEHLQGAWIFEIGELAAMKRFEIEEIKQFLSKTEDRYRVAYDRQVSEFPRKCVFFGTTNNRDFLKDPTGNRRFWPVNVDPEARKLSHWDHLDDYEVSQIWAEILHAYRKGEALELDRKTVAAAELQQSSHMENDPKEGLIAEFLETPIDDELSKQNGEMRNATCAMQVWEECLGRRRGDMRAADARDICAILRRVPGWEEEPNRRIFSNYGKQTSFKRVGQRI